jgi:hypothetical protein
MKKNYILLITLMIAFATFGQSGDSQRGINVLINEFEPNPPGAGADPVNQDFELIGAPNSAFSGFIISIESDNSGTNRGRVDRFTAVSGTFDGNGLLVVTVPDLENPSYTVVLATNFTGDTNTDIDTDDDGVADDISAFVGVFDAIGIPDTTGDEATLYGTDFGGSDFTYTGDEPKLVFRDGVTLQWYAVNDVTHDATDEIYDINATLIPNINFDSNPAAGNSFGATNPIFAVPTNTIVTFVTDVSPAVEGGTVDVCVSIQNPDMANATTVDINMDMASTAMNGADFSIINFAFQLTFPAGSSADQCLTFSITDDATVELEETIVLVLENANGGNAVSLGTGVNHTITIAPSDVEVPNPGDIIITEVMMNPTNPDSDHEYFEVYNTTGADIDMFGWELSDPNSSAFLDNNVNGTITNVTIVPANGYLVLATDGDPLVNGGVTAQYNFDGSGTGLFNTNGLLRLTAGTTLIDEVVWTDAATYPLSSGVSMELSLQHYNAIDNDDPDTWCAAVSTYGDGDFGTPGTANDCNVLSIPSNQIEGFAIYPNPVSDGKLTMTSLSASTKDVQLFSILGKLVYSNSFTGTNNTINFGKLNSGIYFIKVKEGDSIATRKLVIR